MCVLTQVEYIPPVDDRFVGLTDSAQEAILQDPVKLKEVIPPERYQEEEGNLSPIPLNMRDSFLYSAYNLATSHEIFRDRVTWSVFKEWLEAGDLAMDNQGNVVDLERKPTKYRWNCYVKDAPPEVYYDIFSRGPDDRFNVKVGSKWTWNVVTEYMEDSGLSIESNVNDTIFLCDARGMILLRVQRL
jgi:hypothetical protein